MSVSSIPACQECGARHTNLSWRDVPYMGGILMVVVCDTCYKILLARANQDRSKETQMEPAKPDLSFDDLRQIREALDWLLDSVEGTLLDEPIFIQQLRSPYLDQARAALDLVNRELMKE